MFSLRSLVVLATIISYVCSTPVPLSDGSRGSDSEGSWNSSNTSALAPPGLNDLARRKGKLWFGTAADIPNVPGSLGEIYNQEYMTILNDTDIFGEMTCGNIMKVSPGTPSHYPLSMLTPATVRV